MRVNNLQINSNMNDILDTLIIALRKNNSNLFSRRYKDTGDYLMVQCPYHKFGQEKKPSAQFRKSDGLFFCFACKETHSLPDVITYCLNINGKRWLIDNFQVNSIEERHTKLQLNTKRSQPHKQITYVNKDELKKYRFIHPYMLERKLDINVIRKFDVGYDAEHDCITFPNKDINGNILFIATRNVKNKYFHYPNNIDKPVYGLYELYRELKHGTKISEVYIVESMIDCLYLWKCGKFAVALNGLGTPYQLEQLRKSDFRTFILATDNDDAGKKARIKIRKYLNNKLIKELDYNSYGNCKDVNDMTEEQILNANIIFIKRR